jgi:transposase
VYDREFKLEVVRMVQEKGYSIREAAELLGVSKSTLGQWLSEFKEHGQSDSFPGTGRRHSADHEIFELKRRVRDLEEENAILKKAAHIFARGLKKDSK